jgi:hypothetical protein
MPPVLLLQLLLDIGPYFSSWQGPGSSYFMLPAIAGMAGTCHHALLWVEIESCDLLARADLKPRSSPSVSQVARITGVSHWCQAEVGLCEMLQIYLSSPVTMEKSLENAAFYSCHV